MIHIIITLDYEIFGDGSGDVMEQMINPTNEILNLCDENNAKLTIFFEMAEYWALKKAEKNGQLNHMSYQPSELIKKQVQDSVSRNHDVQLHIHPQWLNGSYINGQWVLDDKYWRLSEVADDQEIKENFSTIQDVLFRGKKELEELLRIVDPDYECLVFRAGGWCIQPEIDVIKAMKSVGLKADTSLFRGGYTNTEHAYYDFRDAPEDCSYWWTCEDNIVKKNDSRKNILEIPIHSIQAQRIKWVSRNFLTVLKRLSTEKKRRVINSSSAPFYSSKGTYLKQIIKFLFEKYPIKWDFCNLTGKEMISFLDQAIETHNRNEDCFPLVMIGHSKYYRNGLEFKKFLKNVNSNYVASGKVKFSRMRDIVNVITRDVINDQ